MNGRGTPGPTELGLRLLVGAAVVLLALYLLQRMTRDGADSADLLADAAGTIRIAGLSTPVEILRDARGVPHVYAANEAAGWFGVGYTHAVDRLGQMAWLRRRALGRTAELEGESGLAADRLARLLAIGPSSEQAVDALPGASRAVLEAYSAGINARIARIREGRARLPAPLGQSIEALEPWGPADSIAVVKLLSWCMGGTLETTLVLDDLIQRLDSVQARPFFPGRASVEFGVAPSLPMLRSFEPTAATRTSPNAVVGGTRALCRGIGQPTGGAWIVGPTASASGAPLLLADWQHAPSVPGLFYELQLKAGSLDALGAMLPGSPIFWLGRTRELAWAAVPAGAPIADLFIETLGDRPDTYRDGSAWVALAQREERIHYLDRAGVRDEEVLRLRSTRHGPLIEALSDEERNTVREVGLSDEAGVGDEAGAHDAGSVRTGPSEATARALAWTGARTGDGLSSMLALLRLDGAEGIDAALASHHEPVVALAFADRRGQVGVQVAGWLPHRPLPTGLVPVEGRLKSFDWRHRVALADLPALRLGGAARPYLVVADQPWQSGEGRGEVEFLWRPGDRARRVAVELDRRLRAGALDLRGASEMFADQGTGRAPQVVAALLELARRAGPLELEAEEIAAILERWDGGTGPGSAGAAAYHLVIDRVLEELLRDAFGAALFERFVEAPHVRPQETIERLVLRAAALARPGGWTDEARVAAAARRSLREAWVAINHRLGPGRERWEWGELHRMRFMPFTPFALEADFLGRGLRTGGSAESLSLAWHRPGVSLEVEAASLYRLAIDLSARDRVLSALAPGQSEEPGHPHFDDGIERYRAGKLALFASDRLAIEEEAVSRLLLEPAP